MTKTNIMENIKNIFDQLNIKEHSHLFEIIQSNSFDEIIFHEQKIGDIWVCIEFKVTGRYDANYKFYLKDVSVITFELWLNDEDQEKISNKEYEYLEKKLTQLVKNI